jgi:hypothetical protein
MKCRIANSGVQDKGQLLGDRYLGHFTNGSAGEGPTGSGTRTFPIYNNFPVSPEVPIRQRVTGTGQNRNSPPS